ncbi:hypothetical protein SEVIR_2G295400v4 [Setaria viridis]
MAASQSSRRLDASAPPYVRKVSIVAPPATLELYMGPPVAAVPPVGFYYPAPVLVAPPAPGFPPATSLACWGFPQSPCVGMPGASPSPAGWAPVTPVAMGMPAAPAEAAFPPQPQIPGVAATRRGGRHHHSRRGARPLPRLDVPSRQRGAGRAAPQPSSSGAEVAGAGKGEPAIEPSPRSVLVRSSPPDTPSALPTTFPYPELGSPSPPPSAGNKHVYPPRRRRSGGRATGRHRQAAGGTVRRAEPKARRLFDSSCNSTTVMIRNIPNDFRRTRLMQIIDQHCSIENDDIKSGGVKSEYDFLYLPMDFSTGANKGYAFVNMTTPEAAQRLHHHLHGHRWKVNRSGKTCEVDHGAIEVVRRPLPPALRMRRPVLGSFVSVWPMKLKLQGLDNLVKRFSDSRFDCADEEFLPVWFEPARDGSRTTVPHLVGRMLRIAPRD